MKLCTLFPTFYETPDVTAVAGAVTPPAVEPAAPAVQPGPWAADLTEYFGDDAEAIAKADRYMREKVQPRITHLETDSAPARELYKDLLANPEETLSAVFEEIYGQDKAAEFAALLTPAEAAAVVEAAATGAADADEIPTWAKPLVERDQAARDAELREQGEQEYAATLTSMRAAHTDLTDADMELIHPFMAAAGGDTDVAYAGYQSFKAQFAAANGAAPVAADAVADPPPVLGGPGAPAAAPPTAKTYRWDELGDAIDDFQAEQRAQTPPPVI